MEIPQVFKILFLPIKNYITMLKMIFSLDGKPMMFKILVLVLLILLSALLTFFIGLLIAIPLFGANPTELLQNAGLLQSARDLNILRFFQVINQLGVFILPSLVFAWMVAARPWHFLGANRFPDMLSVIATVLLIFTILPSIAWLIAFNEQLQLPAWLQGLEVWMRNSEDEAARLTKAFLNVESTGGLIFNIFMVGVVASVGEELLFRSVLIRLFKEWFGNIHVAVFISSMLFSMFHLQFFGFLPRFVLGMVMGYLFVWSGSLWLPVIAHFVNNASAVLVYFFYFRGDIEDSVERFGTLENNYLFAFSILVSGGLLLLINLKNQNLKTAFKD